MIYHRHIPSPPLGHFVDWLWYYDHYWPDHDREHVLPDGTFELVINLRDERRKLFSRDEWRSPAFPYPARQGTAVIDFL